VLPHASRCNDGATVVYVSKIDSARAAVEQIADLAKVPPGHRRQNFILAVMDLIFEASARIDAQDFASKVSIQDLKAARARALELRDAIHRLNGLIDPTPIERMVAELSIFLGANPGPDRKPKGKPGPKMDSGPNWQCRWLVRQLLDIVRLSGGHLTLSKLAEQPRGTLVEALCLLQPHVGCVPDNLSYNTLDGLRKPLPLEDGAIQVLRRMFLHHVRPL
jgi:hypothetical protein